MASPRLQDGRTLPHLSLSYSNTYINTCLQNVPKLMRTCIHAHAKTKLGTSVSLDDCEIWMVKQNQSWSVLMPREVIYMQVGTLLGQIVKGDFIRGREAVRQDTVLTTTCPEHHLQVWALVEEPIGGLVECSRVPKHVVGWTLKI